MNITNDRKSFDLIVVGAGPGGCAAAIAARHGGMKRVLVIDRAGFPGGVLGAGLCYLMGFADRGRQVVGGTGEQFVRRLDANDQARLLDGATGRPENRRLGDRPISGNLVVGEEANRIVLRRMLTESGCRFLGYTPVIDAERCGRRLQSIVIETGLGLRRLHAAYFIDATGDAGLLRRAGYRCRRATPEEAMTRTVLIRVAGVENFNLAAVSDRFRQLAAAGDCPLPGQDCFMGYELLTPGEMQLNLTLAGGGGLDNGSLSRLDGELREQIMPGLEWLRRKIPPFRSVRLLDAAWHIGVRAGCGGIGVETIRCDDLIRNTSVARPVAVGHRGFGDHGHSSFAQSWVQELTGTRPIPLGALLPAAADNVVLAGRDISIEPRAVTAIRLTGQCFATGDAAGMIAAAAFRKQLAVQEADYTGIASALSQYGAILS